MQFILKGFLAEKTLDTIYGYFEEATQTIANKEEKPETSRVLVTLGLIGAASLLPSIWKILKSGMRYLRNIIIIDFTKRYLPGISWNPKKPLTKNHASWVLITSPSTNLGKRFCHAFALRGFNLVLVGRNKSRLGDLAGRLMSKYNNNIQILEVNFAKEHDTETLQKYLMKYIANMDISLVVMNPACMQEGSFDELSTKELFDVMRFNINAPSSLLKILTPKLRSRAIERPTGIIFITSALGGSAFIPLTSSFSCSNAYVQHLARGYQQEFAEIDVMYYTETLNQYLYGSREEDHEFINSDKLLSEVKTRLEPDVPFMATFFEFFAVNYWWLFSRYFRDIIRDHKKKPKLDLL
jgi:short-subunit dehydrogenase